MKICVLSHARCRSSVLVSSLSNYYNIENKQEIYDDLKKLSYKERQQIQKSTDKNKETLKIYTNNIVKFTDNLFKNESFVIKVWPRFFNSTEFCFNTESFVESLEDCFRFRSYDKIILSHRDPLDAVCSLTLAVKYGYNSVEEKVSKYITKLKYSNINFNNVDLHPWNQSFLCEIFLIQNIKNYLIKNSIPFTFLDFKEIPSYLEENYPDSNIPRVSHVPFDTKIDYSKAVPNYHQLRDEIENYKHMIVPKLNNIVF